MDSIPKIPWQKLADPLSRLDDALGRLDERLKTSPVADGLRARLDFSETCAIALSDGDLVDPTDLILHDAKMDSRAPTHELVSAHRLYLAARRRAAQGDPADHLSRSGLRRLAGLPGVPAPSQVSNVGSLRREIDALLALTADLEAGDAADILEATSKHAEPAGRAGDVAARPVALAAGDEEVEPQESEAAFVAFQRRRREEAKQLPPALAAVLLQECWSREPPLPNHAWLAALIGGLELRARGRSQNLLLPLEIGARVARRRPKAGQGTFWEEGIAGLEAAVADVAARHTRLLLAAERLEKLCHGRRADSGLRRAGELAIARPLVSLKMIAAHCEVSDRAAQGLVRQLAPLLVEVSGRQRYQAWVLS
jgi:hypothetical protein